MTAVPTDASLTDAGALRIFRGVIARDLPKPEWTHRAHCIFATTLLSALTLEEAEETCPNLIRRYNEAMGGVNSDTEGYHHTITIFSLREIDAVLTTRFGPAPRSESLASQCAAILRSPLADKDYPLTAYPREVLFSVAARRGWVAPGARAVSHI